MKIKVEVAQKILGRACSAEHADPGVCGGPLFKITVPVGSPNSTNSIALCLNHCAQLKGKLPIGTEKLKANQRSDLVRERYDSLAGICGDFLEATKFDPPGSDTDIDSFRDRFRIALLKDKSDGG